MAFIKALNDGSESLVGNKEVKNLADWIDIDAGYTDSPLNTDFNTEVALFGSGAAALMLGGSWSQSALDDINPDLNVGLIPLPMSDNADENKIFTSCSPFWSVNNASAAKDQAKDFLNWLATDPEGQDFLGNQFKLIPGLNSVKVSADAIGALGADTQAALEKDNVYGIYSSYFPDGFIDPVGNTVNKYAAKQLSEDEFEAELQSDWESLQ